MWIERIQKEKLNKVVKSRPVVLLTGARQTGKTSILKKEFPNSNYITFDHLHQMESAKTNPSEFLEQQNGQTIFDEIQYVPELFRHLKIKVDENRDLYGKWILTGSQQFSLMENVNESLAGRISILELETLSAHELRQANISSLKDFLWKGGYPELWVNEHLDSKDFFEGYLRTYIERDLSTLVKVRDLYQFRRFLRLVATRIGQLVNYKDLANNIGISDVTCKHWLHALQISGIIKLLPPYYSNIGKRLVKSPKIYFSDHGLASHLLGIFNMTDWQQSTHRGNLWENFVMMEIIKTHGLVPGLSIFFYRDQNGVEIDFLIENREKLQFIEAKASERVSKKSLNFHKVVPLFTKKTCKSFLTQNFPGSHPISNPNYKIINPLYSTIPL
jgi:uncharacterized protein